MERPLTERLYIYALDWRLRTSNQEVVVEAAKEIARLETENWQLKQACGYPIPADKETINNPFRCGTCDARVAMSQDRDGQSRDASFQPVAAGESPVQNLEKKILDLLQSSSCFPRFNPESSRLIGVCGELPCACARSISDLLRAADHTLAVHGKIDANTPLHKRIADAANHTPNPDDRTDGKHETNLS